MSREIARCGGSTQVQTKQPIITILSGANMFRFILNYDQSSHTISAIITPASVGDILATAVLVFKKDAPAKGDSLRHLDQFGFHHSDDIESTVHEHEAALLRRELGALIHGRFEEKIKELGVAAPSTWEILDHTPSFTVVEWLTYDQAKEVLVQSLNAKYPPAND